jgi:hypothetical protein
MLSIKKLENLLSEKNFVIKTLFIMHELLIYVEIFSIDTCDLFLLYIPSKYEIKVNEEEENSYKIKKMDINEDEMNNILRKYDVVSNVNLREKYDEIELEKDDTSKLEEELKNNYKHKIFLKELDIIDNEHLKDIFCQLTRFKFCVENLQYKLSILYKNYLCTIRSDSDVECYIIKRFHENNEYKMYITLNLETLYSNINTVCDDIKTIKQNIYTILNKNQIKHTEVLNKILLQKNVLSMYSESIYKKKEQYNKYINEFEDLLKTLKNAETIQIEKALNIKEKYAKNTSIHLDGQKFNQLSIVDKELDKINQLKQEVIKNIIDLRRKQENITLKIDKILFDNSILLNLIIRNFSDLSKLV